jgi:hypothetical protein
MSKRVCFSASKISDLLAQGQGRSRLSYIYELAERSIGIDNSVTTIQMLHGINSELDAVSVFVNHMGDGYANSDGHGSQVFFPINEYVGATPDIIADSFVADIKCQYSIHGFFEQNDRVVKRYYDQVQCQMLAMNVDKGYLMNYLTKPEKYGEDEYQEYPFPLSDRFHIHEISKDEQVQSDILEYSEKWFPYIKMGREIMESAQSLDHDEFFYIQFVNKVRFVKLKDLNWIENTKKVYRFNDIFYVQKITK